MVSEVLSWGDIAKGEFAEGLENHEDVLVLHVRRSVTNVKEETFQ